MDSPTSGGRQVPCPFVLLPALAVPRFARTEGPGCADAAGGRELFLKKTLKLFWWYVLFLQMTKNRPSMAKVCCY